MKLTCVERHTAFASRSGGIAHEKGYFAGVQSLGVSAAVLERSGPEVLAQGPLLLPLPKEAEVLEAGALFLSRRQERGTNEMDDSDERLQALSFMVRSYNPDFLIPGALPTLHALTTSVLHLFL